VRRREKGGTRRRPAVFVRVCLRWASSGAACPDVCAAAASERLFRIAHDERVDWRLFCFSNVRIEIAASCRVADRSPRLREPHLSYPETRSERRRARPVGPFIHIGVWRLGPRRSHCAAGGSSSLCTLWSWSLWLCLCAALGSRVCPLSCPVSPPRGSPLSVRHGSPTPAFFGPAERLALGKRGLCSDARNVRSCTRRGARAAAGSRGCTRGGTAVPQWHWRAPCTEIGDDDGPAALERSSRASPVRVAFASSRVYVWPPWRVGVVRRGAAASVLRFVLHARVFFTTPHASVEIAYRCQPA
jgi:hypothetical protein